MRLGLRIGILALTLVGHTGALPQIPPTTAVATRTGTSVEDVITLPDVTIHRTYATTYDYSAAFTFFFTADISFTTHTTSPAIPDASGRVTKTSPDPNIIVAVIFGILGSLLLSCGLITVSFGVRGNNGRLTGVPPTPSETKAAENIGCVPSSNHRPDDGRNATRNCARGRTASIYEERRRDNAVGRGVALYVGSGTGSTGTGRHRATRGAGGDFRRRGGVNTAWTWSALRCNDCKLRIIFTFQSRCIPPHCCGRCGLSLGSTLTLSASRTQVRRC